MDKREFVRKFAVPVFKEDLDNMRPFVYNDGVRLFMDEDGERNVLAEQRFFYNKKSGEILFYENHVHSRSLKYNRLVHFRREHLRFLCRVLNYGLGALGDPCNPRTDKFFKLLYSEIFNYSRTTLPKFRGNDFKLKSFERGSARGKGVSKLEERIHNGEIKFIEDVVK